MTRRKILQLCALLEDEYFLKSYITTYMVLAAYGGGPWYTLTKEIKIGHLVMRDDVKVTSFYRFQLKQRFAGNVVARLSNQFLIECVYIKT